jgi:hypothetical protein
MQRLSFDRVTLGRRDLARPAATEHGTPRPIELFSQELIEAIQLFGFALGRPHALNRRSRHREIDSNSRLYSLPPLKVGSKELQLEGIQRYGFHGLSCESIVHQLANDLPNRLVIAHVGNGVRGGAIVGHGAAAFCGCVAK